MKERPGQPTKPNQILEMDMTKSWICILTIIDRYARYIVGYEISSRFRTDEGLVVFDRAFKNRFSEGTRDQVLILQVDNGCQPTSRKFVKELSTCDLTFLYSAYATPEHNAHIDFYNNHRIHSALGYLTPDEY